MKFVCVTCDLWNMPHEDAKAHKDENPGHVIKDTLGRIRLQMVSRRIT